MTAPVDNWRPALKVGERKDLAEPDGFIYVTGETAAKEWDDRADAEAYLRASVEEYGAYLAGEVYGYVIKNADSEDLPSFGPRLIEDSCWGFIGELGPGSYILEEANRAAESCAEALKAEDAESSAMAARGIVTVAA